MKTYKVPKGLATKIHSTVLGLKDVTSVVALGAEEVAQYEFDMNEIFYIKGPMGRGLQL